jgi:hypothetical protein
MRDTPYVEVLIKLDSYEIANLLAALELVPDTGDWMGQIITKIEQEMQKQGVNPLEFYYPANGGMNTKGVRRHLDNLEFADSSGYLRRPKRNNGTRKR